LRTDFALAFTSSVRLTRASTSRQEGVIITLDLVVGIKLIRINLGVPTTPRRLLSRASSSELDGFVLVLVITVDSGILSTYRALVARAATKGVTLSIVALFLIHLRIVVVRSYSSVDGRRAHIVTTTFASTIGHGNMHRE
jgi:hypothetical protein